jgi:hypothetical protein
MRRAIEWGLASLGAILCIGGAIFTWISQAASNSPGVSLWPLPALLLIEVAFLGFVGFLGVVLESEQRSAHWGSLSWIACGGLIALSVVGAMTISVIVLLAVPALAFGGAAILTDRRRGRKLLSGVRVLIVSGIVNLGLLLGVIAMGRA